MLPRNSLLSFCASQALRLFGVTCLAGAAIVTQAAPSGLSPQIFYEGVLGNSGVSGETLVRLPAAAPAAVKPAGIGLDSQGFLWAFAGGSSINRYAQDGRLIGNFPLPKAMQRDQQALVVLPDQVLILGGESLGSLSISASSGSVPKPLGVAARTISLNAVNGKVAVITPSREICLFDVAAGRLEAGTPLPADYVGRNIALLPDGSIVVDRILLITPDRRQTTLDLPGDTAPQWAGGHLYTFSPHTTIHRMELDGTPSPGVVFGGNSGSMISTLPEDGEWSLPLGIVHLGGARFAASGETGVIHLLAWDEQRHGFSVTRRIGSSYRASGLGLDRQGRVWWNCGYWEWSDGPAAPLRNTTRTTKLTSDDWQVSLLAGNALTGLALPDRLPAVPALIRNTIDFINPYERKDGRYDSLASVRGLPVKPTGSVVLGKAGEEDVVLVDATGKGVRVQVDADGNFRALRGPVTLKLTTPSSAVTSLALDNEGTLLAADGNAIVRLRSEGNEFVETSRVTQWGAGAGDRFGALVYCASDGSFLWVSDTENNRVLLFTVEPGATAWVLQSVFTNDRKLGSLSAPRRIVAVNGRAVVWDGGNQRLVKLSARAVISK